MAMDEILIELMNFEVMEMSITIIQSSEMMAILLMVMDEALCVSLSTVQME